MKKNVLWEKLKKKVRQRVRKKMLIQKLKLLMKRLIRNFREVVIKDFYLNQLITYLYKKFITYY